MGAGNGHGAGLREILKRRLLARKCVLILLSPTTIEIHYPNSMCVLKVRARFESADLNCKFKSKSNNTHTLVYSLVQALQFMSGRNLEA